MQHYFLKFLIVLTLFVSVTFNAAQALEIKNVRFGVHPDKTRMVIELSNKVDFRAFMLPRDAVTPYRLVVDMPSFEWQAGSVSAPKTAVLDVRSGTLSAQTKRIVVDLGKPAEIKDAFILPRSNSAPDRLVIDFKIITDAQFNAAERPVFGNLTEEEVEQDITALIESQTRDQAGNDFIIPKRKPVTEQTASPNTKATPLYKPLIVIDAGHGGGDPGAVGAGRSFEKHVTLAAAKALKARLESTGRYRAALTRDNDTYLKLYQRRDIARQKKADLFISLHADSIDKPNVRGASIYTLSDKASDAQTARLAARENQVDLIAGVDLSHEDKEVANILIDLAMRDTMNQSKFFANTVVSKMQRDNIRILQKPHRYAGFAVLKSPDVPSVLVEMGFMSNGGEARLLATKDYQQKMARTLTDSIDAYFDKVRKNNLE